MTDELPPYAVMQTVYAGDDPAEFEQAVESVLSQTVLPEQLLVVADGPLTDGLAAVVEDARAEHPGIVDYHELPENRGRGAAARVGVEACDCDLVGIMSSDDVCVPDRFERQVRYLAEHPDVDVVGGQIAEFTDDPDDPEAVRRVPTDPDAVARLARFRSPMNEVTVLFRRESVLSAGNYRAVDRMEDYDLWVRLLLDGATLANVDEVLVKARGGDAMFARRGGFEYAREEFRQQLALYRMGFVGAPRALVNLAVRVPVRVLPNSVRSFVYRRFLRDTDGATGAGS